MWVSECVRLVSHSILNSCPRPPANTLPHQSVPARIVHTRTLNWCQKVPHAMAAVVACSRSDADAVVVLGWPNNNEGV